MSDSKSVVDKIARFLEDSINSTDKCDGCIWLVVGFRRDRKGNIIFATACESERFLACGCCPQYDLSRSLFHKQLKEKSEGEKQ